MRIFHNFHNFLARTGTIIVFLDISSCFLPSLPQVSVPEINLPNPPEIPKVDIPTPTIPSIDTSKVIDKIPNPFK